MYQVRGLSNSVEMARVAEVIAPVHVATVQFVLTGLSAHIATVCLDSFGKGDECFLDRGLLIRAQVLSESLKCSQNIFWVTRLLQNWV